MSATNRYRRGNGVKKTGGDYEFYGNVVAVFTKNSGVIRYVVENEAGILHIFSEGDLDPWEGTPCNAPP
jgi:hypothetical protein